MNDFDASGCKQRSRPQSEAAKPQALDRAPQSGGQSFVTEREAPWIHRRVFRAMYPSPARHAMAVGQLRCQHRSPTALALWIIRWGSDASSDVLRGSARCARCGRKGATVHITGGALLAPIRGCRGQPACSLLQTSLIVRMLAPRGPHPPVFDPHNGLRSELYGSKPAYSSSTRLNEIEPLIWLGASARRRAEPLPAGSSGGRLVICACDHS